MGVTIHFEGQLKSEEDYDFIIRKAKKFATLNNMPFEFFNELNKHLLRVKDEQDWNYTGAVKGIKIHPHEKHRSFVVGI